jgi:hypothetical protein
MPDPRAFGPPPAWWLSAQEYAGIGVVGLVLLGLALYNAALAGVPDAGYLRVILAVVGGSLAMLGLGRWNVLRRYPDGGRRRPEAPAPPPSAPFQSYVPPPRDDEPRRRVAPPLEPLWTGRVPSPRARSSLVLAVAGVMFLGLLLGGIPLPAASGASSHAPTGSASTVASTTPRAPSSTRPSGAITCTPFYPSYGSIGGLWPPLPKYSQQTPCKVSADEVHASFSSPVLGSGDQVEFPVHLPGTGNDSFADTYLDVYLGMVVKGDNASVDGQSYAVLVMTPYLGGGGATAWDLHIGIWSLVTNTSCPTGFNFTWRAFYGCELDNVGSGNGLTLKNGVPGNTSANVTFYGSPSESSHPLTIYFNDSTNTSFSANWSATKAATGTFLFQPYYATQCPDLCILNWTMPFGLGEGIDLCDQTCFSYNATTQLGTPPVELGTPRFWNGLTYSGTYLYTALESTTGACGAVGGVPPCDAYAQSGDYPEFSFNGTTLDFGANYSFATENFGGALHQFNAYATSTDFVPLFLDELTNSSRVGYLDPGTPLNVSVRAQALGTIRWVNLSYQVPGGTLTNTSMHLVGGSASNGFYNGTVPSAGNNGTISFRTEATDAAYATVVLPPVGLPAGTVNRTKIPTVTIGLDTSPAGCGGISVNGGHALANGSSAKILAGIYSIDATGCYPYAFEGWQTTGGVAVSGSGPSAQVTARWNGTVTARLTYYHPVETVKLAWSPTSCGETILNGTPYDAPGPQTALLREGGNYSLVAVSCGGYSFSGWTVTSTANLSILGPVLSLHGNGTLTATFVPTSTSYPVIFSTDPSTCGGVLLNDAGYVSGESVNLVGGDTYPIGPDPCYGWGFAGAANVSTTGSVSVTGGTLSVSGGGTVNFSYYKLTLVDILTSPSTCGSIDWDGALEANGVALNVTNHTVHSVTGEPCAGYYLERLAVSGDLSLVGSVLTVNGPGSLEAVFRAGIQEYSVVFETEPANCGAIVFDGTQYKNAQYADVLPGSVHTLSAAACPGYGVVTGSGADGFTESGGISFGIGVAYVNGSGSISVLFHPLVSVEIETSPATCGAVVIDGSPYTDGATPMKPINAEYSVSAEPCANDVLAYWQTSGGATIANGTLELNASAIVVAVFVPALYAITLGIAPASCGEVTIGGLAYGNNSTFTLTAGAYPISGTLCVGFELLAWETTGGLNVSSGSLLVSGPGNVTEVAGPIPPTAHLEGPGTTSAGAATFFSASIEVPVPPYNYTYNWSFGDGTSATTPSNFTSHDYPSPGTYRVTVTVHDPYGRTSEANTSVTVVPAAGGTSFTIGTEGIAIIGLAAAVVVAGAIVSVVRARRAGGDGGPGGPSGPGTQEEAS